ncbi:magnesium transporter CorA family protein [Domibacillus tundrae]|uniref:magnesium transporter CorA family protein n=1 Tax=Domibacillus tundrae TaxID=1587527 RepID=UPI000617E083|nr:magnesium transporter CorA family protein [Domibacillus tundrae]
MEHSFHSSQWTWKEFDIKNDEQAKELAKKHHTCKKWIEDVKTNKTNSLEMYTGTPGEEVLWGSLVYLQHADEKNNRHVFHFYLTRNEMVTANLDLSKLDFANVKAMKEKMHHSETSVEGFLVLIGEIMTHFLMEIDKFEVKLRDLLWEIKERNNTSILDRAANTDHELLIWKNLIIPMMETRMAVEEAFGDEVMEGKQYKRTKRRIERSRTLIREYEEEIDALLDLENVVSTHRGNEIMKTLTVITTLFTPVMALGAIWGMNFKHMPELEWKYGYLFSGTLIGASTFALYVFLKKKGWMGDILAVRSKKSFFK